MILPGIDNMDTGAFRRKRDHSHFAVSRSKVNGTGNDLRDNERLGGALNRNENRVGKANNTSKRTWSDFIEEKAWMRDVYHH